MDIVLPKRSPLRKRLWMGAAALGVLALIFGLSRLKPAAPEVDRQSLLLDRVQEGAMVFQVRGTGTLVPVDVRMITAQVPCKVERILLFPGTEVREDSIIAELSSPELQQSAQDAFWSLKRAESDYSVSALNQKGTVASARAAEKEAAATLKAYQKLFKEGLQSESDVLRANAKYEDCAARLATEEARMALFEGRGGQLAPARAALEQARAQYALKQAQTASLHVRAGMAGMLQQVPLQVGQQLAPGANLAKVAKPMPLKAELKVSETQAKDIQVGQAVAVDTRNGIVQGRVIRIDPSVQNGTVTVDASLEGALPKGARPDLSVEGIIELDHADRAIKVGRPVQAQSFATLSLFKLSPDGREATRIKVRLGRASVSTIEVLEGLHPGDQVILSDTSAWDGVDRIRIH
ncbi:RND transporter [Geothrix limicola]|uniref:RND transporter n=1 Tax=Geothrix limicola TaxID=2927978 RepID=A0ABQ5QGK6_9BACT|nr:efflux RND transporter periplasmic adaptor subunit [Geothrix limicola]GLH73483.1 RND transporter [Geothrix limicola]